MRSLNNRVGALEAGSPNLSPAVKQWLGHTLTDAERAALIENPDVQDFDVSTLSTEARVWLGID